MCYKNNDHIQNVILYFYFKVLYKMKNIIFKSKTFHHFTCKKFNVSFVQEVQKLFRSGEKGGLKKIST